MSIINPSGKDIMRVTTELCGRPLTLEVNRVGFRSTASVLVRYGDTVVLGTAQVGTRPVTLDRPADPPPLPERLPPGGASGGYRAEHGPELPPRYGGDGCREQRPDADGHAV